MPLISSKQKYMMSSCLMSRCPRISGVEVLKHIKEHATPLKLLMLTNIVDVKTAIETTKLGAYDFVSKPYETAETHCDSPTCTRAQTTSHRKGSESTCRPVELIGECQIFKDVVHKAIKLASSEAFVLIQGASGTG